MFRVILLFQDNWALCQLSNLSCSLVSKQTHIVPNLKSGLKSTILNGGSIFKFYRVEILAKLCTDGHLITTLCSSKWFDCLQAWHLVSRDMIPERYLNDFLILIRSCPLAGLKRRDHQRLIVFYMKIFRPKASFWPGRSEDYHKWIGKKRWF